MATATIEPSPTTERLSDPDWAWAAYQPDAARPWNLRWAGHLYRRAAFGGTWDELQTALKAGPQATIDKLLQPLGDPIGFNRDHDDYEKAAAQSSGVAGLQAWWLRRMCQTPWPLLEMMTLFWHNHFALSHTRVRDPLPMCRFLQLLRQHALGNYGVLLEGILNEPAVFVALDAGANRRDRRSGHLPRVLLEQFTVGPERFTDADVQAAARALAGWFISQNKLNHSAPQQPPAPATLLGETGTFEKHDLAGILSRQPATAQLLARKLYRWFISETATPDEPLIASLAADFQRNLDLKSLLGTMLRSNLFFSSAAYRQKIKSPVEFALGIIRPLKGTVGTVRLGADLADLGQDLYNPPTLQGWAGGKCWINGFTLPGRAKLACALLAASGDYGGKLDPVESAAKQGRHTLAASSDYLADLLFQGDVLEPVQRPATEVAQGSGTSQSSTSEAIRQSAMHLAALPEFNLA
jgi:uncharacterized protein (DUF1800 family)